MLSSGTNDLNAVEKGDGAQRPKGRKSKLLGIREKKELDALKIKQLEQTNKSKASPKNIDRQHSRDDGHFNRYPKRPGATEAREEEIKQKELAAQRIEEEEKRKEKEEMARKQKQINRAKESLKTITQSKAMEAKLKLETEMQEDGTHSSSELNAMELREQIKRDMKKVNEQVSVNLARQKSIAAEKIVLKEEEETLIARVERLRQAAKSGTGDVLAISSDLIPLGVGAYIKKKDDVFSEDDENSDDENEDDPRISKTLSGKSIDMNVNSDIESEASSCATCMASKLAISIMLFLSIFGGVVGVGYVLLDAGRLSVNRQVNATLNMAARASESHIRTLVDSDHQGVNMLADAVGRGDGAGGITHMAPATSDGAADFLWLEARDMLHTDSVYFVGDQHGTLHGAQISATQEVRVIERLQDGVYGYYPIAVSKATSFAAIPDVDKKRKTSTKKVAGKENYDPKLETWYINAKAKASTGKPATTAWSDLHFDHLGSGSWTLTSARGIHSHQNQNGANIDATPTFLGVMGFDFKTSNFRSLLASVRNSMVQDQSTANGYVQRGTITMFKKSSDGKTVQMVASSDPNVQTVADETTTIEGLEGVAFAAGLPTTMDTWTRDALKASASYAEQMRAGQMATTMKHKVVNSSYLEDIYNTDTTYAESIVVSVSYMEDVAHGTYIVVVLPRSMYFDYLTICVTWSLVVTALVTVFITAIVYVGDETMSKTTGMGITPIASSVMFITFLGIIILWIAMTDNVMKFTVRTLANQMNEELISEMQKYLHRGPLLNRWNYVLASMGALPIAMHELAIPTAMRAFHLRTDAVFVDELRRAPSVLQPHMAYSGGVDGSFCGAYGTETDITGLQKYAINAIDASTGVSAACLENAGKPLMKKYVASVVSGTTNEIEVYGRDVDLAATSHTYDPRARPWYIGQITVPDVPKWSQIYVFSELDKMNLTNLGITATQGYHLPNNKMGGGLISGGQVLAVDYTMRTISAQLNATMDLIKQAVPDMLGTAYLIENTGLLVGVSSDTDVTRKHFDEGTQKFGTSERINGKQSKDPIVQATYNELIRRTDHSHTGSAAEVAGFVGFAGIGSSEGRFLIRSTRLIDNLGLNWTTVIAVSEDSFFQVYRANSVKAIVIGSGVCIVAVYVLSMLIAFSIKAREEKKAKEEEAENSHNSASQSLFNSKGKKIYETFTLKEQAMRAYGSEGYEDPAIVDETGRNLTELSPDSQEFFDIWSDVLRSKVESANLANRLNNVNQNTEPRPPSIFKQLSSLLRENSGTLRELFDEFDIDGSGEIDLREFGVALRKHRMPGGGYFDPKPQELKLLFDSLDKDHSGEISYEELLADEENMSDVKESAATAAEKLRAVNYINLVYNRGLSLPYILQLERSLDFRRLNGYLLFESSLYKNMYSLVIVLSLSLAFIEAPSSWGSGARTGFLTEDTYQSVAQYILPINGICLFFYVADMIFETYLRGFRFGGGNIKSAQLHDHHVGTSKADTKTDFTSKNKCCDLFDYQTGGALRMIGMTRWLLVSLMIFDYVYRAANPYFTGPGASIDNFQRNPQVLFLPISAMIRPFWLLTRYRDVRRSAQNFMKTLFAAADVFVLFGLLMVIGSIMGVLLLSGRMNDYDVTNYNKFDNVLSGFLTLFVYMASAENYPDVAYPAVNCNRDGLANSLEGGLVGLGCPETAFHIYSMVFQLLGAFLIVSLVIAVFEGEFAAYTKKQEQQDRKQKNLGLVAAFIMLDKDGGGSLDPVEFLAFVNGTCNTGRKFSVKRGLELSGPEFMEWVGELAHEFNPKQVQLPHELIVSPYRRSEFCAIDIPKKYQEGQSIQMPGGKKGQYDIYEYTVPPGTVGGQKKLVCAGRSVTKQYPEDTVTFQSLSGRELAHWMAYNSKGQHFPYDPESILVDDDGKDLDFVTYYRYVATDICCTTAAAAAAMGEVQDGRPEQEARQDAKARALLEKQAKGLETKVESKSQEMVPLDNKKKKTFNRQMSMTAAKVQEMSEYDMEHDIEMEDHQNAVSEENGGKKRVDEDCTKCCLSLKKYLNGNTHRSLMFVLTMVNIAQLGMYGTGSITGDEIGATEAVLDTISSIFLIWGFVEIGLRIAATGWRDFWHVGQDFFQQAANRFDFKCNMLTLIVMVLCIISKFSRDEPIWFLPWDPKGRGYNDWSRIVLALPLMRAFSTVRLLRDIVMGMITVIPLYAHVFTLLLIFFYLYGAVGCYLFASSFKYNADYILPDANFNSFLDALMTLFQLFVGEAWNDVMEAAMNTGKTVPAVLYFVSFIVIMTLLFTNLIIGIICSGYESINHVRKGQTEGVAITVNEVMQALKEGEASPRLLRLIYRPSGEIVITRAKK